MAPMRTGANRRTRCARRGLSGQTRHKLQQVRRRLFEPLETRALLDGDPLDRTFGNAGTVVTELRDVDVPRVTALQSDGKIVVGGYTYNASEDADIFVVRFDSDGALDPTFDDDGIAIFELSAGDDILNALIVQPDGRI